MELSILLEPNDEGGYTAYHPQIPGCVSEGKSKDEAIKNYREALKLHLELDLERVPLDKPGMLIEKTEV